MGRVDLAKYSNPVDIDLANPTLRRTRYITKQILDGKDAAELLHHRGIDRPVAQAVVRMVGKGTAHRPNARRGGHPLTLAIRLERDREALYRGAYLLKAAERVQAAVDDGASIADAIKAESRFTQMHEDARKGRLDAVVRAQLIGQRFGEVVSTSSGTRTMLGWYLNPLLNNDPECEAANGHNFYAEEGTLIGFPGAVHLGCGCYAGPPISGAALVNDAVRGITDIHEIPSRPKFATKRKARMSA